MQIAGYVITDPGKVRKNNEDSAALRWQTGSSDAGGIVMGLVADGMGGAECGEVASQLASDIIPRSFFESSQPAPEALRAAMSQANAEIFRTAGLDSSKHGMGTTAAVVVVDGDKAWCGWVGDSRIYLLRNERCYRISEDHTMVREMVQRGLLTAEEASHHDDRNVLSRAMGTKPQVQIDVTEQALTLNEGDRLLLCSDGLHDLVSDDELAQDACEGQLKQCSESLLQRALDRGGYDNVSLVLMEAGKKSAAAAVTREVLVSW